MRNLAIQSPSLPLLLAVLGGWMLVSLEAGCTPGFAEHDIDQLDEVDEA